MSGWKLDWFSCMLAAALLLGYEEHIYGAGIFPACNMLALFFSSQWAC
jgi:hypothetical protein